MLRTYLVALKAEDGPGLGVHEETVQIRSKSLYFMEGFISSPSHLSPSNVYWLEYLITDVRVADPDLGILVGLRF